MSGFDLSGYVTVPERLTAAKEKYPDGRFVSRIIDCPFPGFLAVEAKFYRTADDPTPAVGLAWEPVPGKTPYTKDSELQNAETSAWGRALIAAFVVDASKGIASAEEVRNRSQSVASSSLIVERPLTTHLEEGDGFLKLCPSCSDPLDDKRATFVPGGKDPAWKCPNRDCVGGSPKKNGQGHWSWASWNPHEFDDSPQTRWAKNTLWGLVIQDRQKALEAAAVGSDIDDVSLGRAFFLECLNVSGQVEPLSEDAAKAVVEAAEQIIPPKEPDSQRPF